MFTHHRLPIHICRFVNEGILGDYQPEKGVDAAALELDAEGPRLSELQVLHLDPGAQRCQRELLVDVLEEDFAGGLGPQGIQNELLVEVEEDLREVLAVLGEGDLEAALVEVDPVAAQDPLQVRAVVLAQEFQPKPSPLSLLDVGKEQDSPMIVVSIILGGLHPAFQPVEEGPDPADRQVEGVGAVACSSSAPLIPAGGPVPASCSP